MSIAGWNLQKAVYARLAADATLNALVGNPPRIHDDVPAGAVLPYVQIGDATEADWSTVSELGSEHQLTIYVWSGGAGAWRRARSCRRFTARCTMPRSPSKTIAW